jgi:hypothetical protein
MTSNKCKNELLIHLLYGLITLSHVFKILNWIANRETKIILKLIINAFFDSLKFVSKKVSGWNGPVHVPPRRPCACTALAMSKLSAPALRCAPEILNHQRSQAWLPAPSGAETTRHVDGAGCLKVFKWLAGPELTMEICPAPSWHAPHSHLPFSLVPYLSICYLLLVWAFKLLFLWDAHPDVVADESHSIAHLKRMF